MYNINNIRGNINIMNEKTYAITFISIKDDGTQIKTICKAKHGTPILDVAEQYNVHIEHACERSLACSTCHCIPDKESYKKFPSKSEDEDILLDTAFQPTIHSRLACQLNAVTDCTILIPNKNKNLA
ncbi:MAG: 2Fe-2S iron-sulfur cluster-binding protein [Pseudomonadota bacterium]